MKRQLRSPIYWFGGKGNLVAQFLPLLPPHVTYVEPFGGGASLLFAKEPSPVEVYNDLHGGLVNFFRVLRDPEQFAVFHEKALCTPYAREEYDHCLQTWEATADPVEQAYRFFVVAKMSFSGKLGQGWASVVTTSRRGMAGTASRWRFTLEGLPALHERLMRVQVESEDWAKVLARYDRPETLFYCDPPYVPETRRSGGYAYELTLADHERLAAALAGLAGRVLLSGYQHPVYAGLEAAGWRRHDVETSCWATGRTRASGLQGKGSIKESQARVESIWLNPAAQAALGG